MILFGIASNLFSIALSKGENGIFYSRLTILTLFYTIVYLSSNDMLNNYTTQLSIFNGLFFNSDYTVIFRDFIYIVSFLILFLTSSYPYTIQQIEKFTYPKVSWEFMLMFKEADGIRGGDFNPNMLKNNVDQIWKKSTKRKEDKWKKLIKRFDTFKLREYPLLILFIICGTVLLISANDIVSIFLSIELQSYGLYLLCTLNRSSENSVSAGLMYFLIGGLASTIILLGLSLLYLNIGSTSLDALSLITNISNTEHILYDSIFYRYFDIQVSLFIISIGFLIKISAAPFHFWSPYVYDYIPTIVTTFVAVLAKISIFVLLLELMSYTNEYSSLRSNLILSSCLSLIVGSILGLRQHRIKKLYAFSTISHIGFMLLALNIYSVESIQAFVFYLMQYSISNINAFFILILIGYYKINNMRMDYRKRKLLYYKKPKPLLREFYNSPIQFIPQLTGLLYKNPVLSLSLCIVLFSLIGVPPSIGFFAKQMVLSASINNGYIFMAAIAIITSVISAAYYLYVVSYMFEKVEKQKKKKEKKRKDFLAKFSCVYDHALKYKNRYVSTALSAGLHRYHKYLLSHNYFELCVFDNYLSFIISTLTLIMLAFIIFIEQPLNTFSVISFLIFN